MTDESGETSQAPEERRSFSPEDLYREQIRVMSQAMPTAVSITDRDGAVLWVNPFWSRLTGLSFDESLGDGWRGCIDPDDLAAIDAAFTAARPRERRFQAEVRIRVADGALRWTKIRGEPLISARGRLEGWITVSDDIHEQKTAAEALTREKARYEALARIQTSVLFELDAEGALKPDNAAWSAFTGVDVPAARAISWLGCVDPEQAAEAGQEWAAAAAEPRPFRLRMKYRHAPSGAFRWVRATAVPLPGPDGRPAEWMGALVDVHEQVSASLALRESEARFRLVAENAPIYLWMGDADGGCVYLNRAQREFWGVPEDLAGFTWGSTLLEEDAAALHAVFGEAMAAEKPFEVEARYRRADGEIRSLLTRANPRHDADGKFLGMIGVNVDVTEARKAELHQRLLTNELNHRVKNTLATVQALAAQTLRAYDDTRTARQVLDGRLHALSAAHNVLTGEHWEAADVADIVAEAIRPYVTSAGEPIRAAGPAARVTPQAALGIALVLHELATNAVKYGALSSEVGHVDLTWSQDGDMVAFQWREGGGPPVAPPTRQGFGARLLANLAADLGAPARIDYAPTGVVCAFAARRTAP